MKIAPLLLAAALAGLLLAGCPESALPGAPQGSSTPACELDHPASQLDGCALE